MTTEPRFTIERGRDDSDMPHQLYGPGIPKNDAPWLTTEAADALEPLLNPQPTMSGREIADALNEAGCDEGARFVVVAVNRFRGDADEIEQKIRAALDLPEASR